MILRYRSLRHFLNTYAVIVAMGIVSFVVRFTKFKEFGPDLQVKLTITSLILVSFFWESLRFVDHRLNKILPFEENIPKRIIVQLVLGSMIGFVIRLVIYYFGEPYVPFHLDNLFLATTWALYIGIPVAINLGFFTGYFIDRWKDSLVRAERLEKEKSQVQFDNLKNQLNPHFLFNALASLNSLIFENQALASEFLQQLSKVYRYVLQNKDRNFVTLRTELDFISHYVMLLETRFSGALTITFDIGKEAVERAIVPVTLQILIENALKHNIVDHDKPLSIEVVTIGDYLVVSNNLQVRRRVETSNKVGLENLRSLYQFLTDRPVSVESTAERFAVKIPLI